MWCILTRLGDARPPFPKVKLTPVSAEVTFDGLGV